MSYETLDAIADSVNPILGLIALTWPWLQWRRQWRRAALHVLLTLLSVALAYAMSALDRTFGWWPSLGLDFSTHTALCVTLIVSLCFVRRSLAALWIGVFIAYAALMVYQDYHSVADICTTLLAVLPIALGLRLLAGSLQRYRISNRFT